MNSVRAVAASILCIAVQMVSALLLLHSPAVCAQPDLSQKSRPGIADAGSGSAYYHFKTLAVTSDDGERHYRIVIGIPKKAAATAGYPAIYLLDGNAALEVIDEPLLAILDAADPPVIVALAYNTDLRFDVRARTYDYTPPFNPVNVVDEEQARGRTGGGAARFQALLAQRIMPAVEQMTSIDTHRQSLWGHSYGGLFVLHALFTQPNMFRNYVAASPSLWWQHGAIQAEANAFMRCHTAAGPVLDKHLWIMTGSAEHQATAAVRTTDPALLSMLAARAATAPDAARQLALQLAAATRIETSYMEIPGLSHGPMLAASLVPALRIAAGLPAFGSGAGPWQDGQ